MKIRRSRYLYILLAITALLVGVLYFIAVPVADDYWFMTPRGKAVNFADTFALIRDRLATDQMRLPNQLLPLLLNHMARWLQALLVALLTLLTLIGGVRLASRGDAPTRGYVWAALFMLCLPWYDYLLALSYMLNYVLTSCLILWTIWIFCRRLEEPMGGAASGAVIFLALLAGWSHEAFSVPLFGGLLLWMLMESRHASRMRFYTRGRRRSLDEPFAVRVGMLVAIAAGILIIAFSPSIWSRASEGAGLIASMPLWEFAMQLGPSLLLLFVMLIMVAIRAIGRDISRETLALAAMSLAAETIALLFYSGPRTTWAAELFAITAIAQTSPEIKGVRSSAAAAAVCWAVVIGNLVAAIISQRQLSAETREVISRYEASPGGTIFYDITTPKADLSLFKTTVRNLSESTPRRFIESYYGKPLTILPERLESFKPDESLRSGTTDYPLYIYNGLIVSDKYPDRERLVLMMQESGGRWVESRYRVDPFTAGDGAKLWLLTPHLATLQATATLSDGNIRAAKLQKRR